MDVSGDGVDVDGETGGNVVGDSVRGSCGLFGIRLEEESEAISDFDGGSGAIG